MFHVCQVSSSVSRSGSFGRTRAITAGTAVEIHVRAYSYNQLDALTSHGQNAGISMDTAGKPGRSRRILRELDVRSPGDRVEFIGRSLQSSAGGSASGSSEPD